MRYTKDTPRLAVKFIDAETEEELFEIKDRSWMNIGEIFSDQIASNIIEKELKDRKITPPEKILILAVGELTRQ